MDETVITLEWKNMQVYLVLSAQETLRDLKQKIYGITRIQPEDQVFENLQIPEDDNEDQISIPELNIPLAFVLKIGARGERMLPTKIKFLWERVLHECDIDENDSIRDLKNKIHKIINIMPDQLSLRNLQFEENVKLQTLHITPNFVLRVVSSTVDSDVNVDIEYIQPGSSYSPTFDEEAGYSPRFDEEASYSPRFDEEASYSPTFDEEASYSPTFDEEASYSPTFDEEESYSPTFDEEASYSPTFDEEASYSPTFDEEASYSPTFDEEVSYSPTFDEEASYSPTFDEEAGSMKLPANSEELIHFIRLHTSRKGKKLLIFNLDILYDSEADEKNLVKRPYLDEFLNEMNDFYDFGIWSHIDITLMVKILTELGIIGNSNYKLLFYTDVLKILLNPEGQDLTLDKALTHVSSRYPKCKLKNTIVCYAKDEYILPSPGNGIKIAAYYHYNHEADTELFDLSVYLRRISGYENFTMLDHTEWKNGIAFSSSYDAEAEAKKVEEEKKNVKSKTKYASRRILVQWEDASYNCHYKASDTIQDFKFKLASIIHVEPSQQIFTNLPYPDDSIIKKICLNPDFVLLVERSVEPSSSYTDEQQSSSYTDEQQSSSYTDEQQSSSYTDEQQSSSYTDEQQSSSSAHMPYAAVNFVALTAVRYRKKLLLLDLDKILCDIESKEKMFVERPHLQNFLTTVYKFYDIGIWSFQDILTAENILKEINIIDNPYYKILFYTDVLGKLSVAMHRMLILTQPLEYIWSKFDEYEPSNTLVCFNGDKSILPCVSNILKVVPYYYYNNSKDRELLDLSCYLKHIALSPDFPNLSHSAWKFSLPSIRRSERQLVQTILEENML